MPKAITAAVTYTADQIPAKGELLRDAADTRVAELIAEKVKALVVVNHELSPALPRDPCHVKPYREYLASAKMYVLTESEMESLKKGE